MHHCRHGKESICCRKRCGNCGCVCGDHCGPDIKSTPNECMGDDDCPCMCWTEGGKETPKKKAPKTVILKEEEPEEVELIEETTPTARDTSIHEWSGTSGAWSCIHCGVKISSDGSPRASDLSTSSVMIDCSMEKVFRDLG